MWIIVMKSMVWMGIIPFFLGILVLFRWKREQDNIAECLTAGYFTMFAICQMIAVPLILNGAAFHTFCRILAAIYMVLAAAGCFLGRKWLIRMTVTFFKELFHHAWTVYAAVAAVAVQAYYYIQYMVTNLDDAYFIAVATTAVETDTMYRFSAYTGKAVQALNLRYCLSPFYMYQAFLSKYIGVHPSTLAHTILAPVLVVIAYLVYRSMGRLLFDTDHSNTREEKMTGLFILFLSMVHVTSYYCMRNQGSVLLVRIWQGKAALAAVLFPFLFYHCYRMACRPKEKGNLIILWIATLSCCLVSSMGIALPMVMLGIFALLFGLLQKNWKYMFRMMAGTLPCILYGVLYIVLKMLR